jgi:hypothetical protein
MTDPSNALQSFQQGLRLGQLVLQRGVLEHDLYVHADRPNGEFRLTYVRLQEKTVTAFVEFVSCDPIDGVPCFNVGYAVPEGFRNQGRAKEAIIAAISEMQHGLGKIGYSIFYIEAVVGTDNVPSQHVAEHVISDNPVAITDQTSGLSALQYVRKIEPAVAN